MTCNYPEQNPNRSEPEQYESNFVREAVQWFRDTFGVSSNIDVKRAAELDDLDARELYSRQLAEMGVVNPEEFNRVSSWVAAKLNQINKSVFSPDALSPEGQLRLNMLDIGRVASSIVNNVVRFQQVQMLKRISSNTFEILNKYGIKGDRANEIFQEFVEYGHIPEKSLIYNSDMARTFNQRRYEKWRDGMLDIMTQEEFDTLVSQAFEYASINRQVREAARQLGVDVGDLEGIGYFTRIMSRDFALRFGEINDDPNLYQQLRNGSTLFSTVFNKVRETQLYAPNEALHVLAAALNDTPENLRNLIDNPLEWRDYLDSKPPALIDAMVESGMLQQIPMTSKEVFEWFVKKYELPYQGLNEMFLTDPQGALSEYAKSLGKAAGNSRIFSYVSTRGIEEGWSMSRRTFERGEFPNGTTKEDWVKLGDINWKDLGLDYKTIKNREDVYLHRNAAEQLKAVIFISSNPAALSNLASGVQKVAGMLRLTILSKEAWRYTSRVLVQNTIQSLAGSGLDPRAVPLYFQGMLDIFRATKDGVDFLDDTQPVVNIAGKMYTKRAAFLELLSFRYNEFVPLSPGDVISSAHNKKEWVKKVFSLYSPRTAQRAASYAATASKNGDLFKYAKGIGKYYVDTLKESLGSWFAPFASFANISDVAARWTILQLKGSNAKTVQDAFRYTDDYIYSPDSAGTFSKSYGSLFQPFMSYAMYAPTSTIRHALRQPHKFVAYHKLISVLSRQGSKPCNESPEIGFQSWMFDGAPVLIGCDGKNPLVMQIQSIDQSSDTLSYLSRTGEDITALIGLGFGGTSEKQRKQAMKDGVSEFFRTQLNQSYWKGVFQFLSNTDLDTGKEFRRNDIVTWNGLEMSPRVRALLEDIPIPGLPAPIITFNELNRINPFDMFGRREIKDAMGKVIRPKKLSWFNTRRTDKDGRYDDAVARNETLNLMRLLGLSINVARVAENVQNAEGRIEQDLIDLKGEINRQKNQYLDLYSKLPESERQKRYQSITEMAQRAALVEIDLMRVRQWMSQNNIPSSQVLDKLKEITRESTTIDSINSNIPMPNAEGQAKVINEYYNTVRELSNETTKR